MSVVRFCSY